MSANKDILTGIFNADAEAIQIGFQVAFVGCSRGYNKQQTVAFDTHEECI